MFIAALCTIAKIPKQLKCPMTGERIKIMIHIYMQRDMTVQPSTHTHTDIHTHNEIKQKNEMMPFTAIWMDLSY